MAVLDTYANPDLNPTTYKTTSAFKSVGSHGLIKMIATFEVAAADDDGSVYRLFTVPSTLVPVSLRLACDAITGSTAWNCGLYTPGIGGAVVDDNIFGNAINISAGYSRILALDLLVTVDIANAQKMIYELPINGTPYTVLNRPTSFDIALTATTVGTGAGTVTVWGEFLSP